jgi:hypothetical protein
VSGAPSGVRERLFLSGMAVGLFGRAGNDLEHLGVRCSTLS